MIFYLFNSLDFSKESHVRCMINVFTIEYEKLFIIKRYIDQGAVASLCLLQPRLYVQCLLCSNLRIHCG